MPDLQPSSFEELDLLLREFLQTKSYSVKEYIGNERMPTFTYLCDVWGITFFAKMVIYSKDESQNAEGLKRRALIENEIVAYERLWNIADDGEFKSFLLPAGPEIIWDEPFGDYYVYGYTRLHNGGPVAKEIFEKGNYKINLWVKILSNLVSEIDSLPNLDLPRTQLKKTQDFHETITKNITDWSKKLEQFFASREIEGYTPEFGAKMKAAVSSVLRYYEYNEVLLGTAHCDLVPDHLIYDMLLQKPYVVSFTRLNQNYPRFFDAAKIYSWILVVLGDEVMAIRFWEEATRRAGLANKEAVEAITNHILVGTLCDFLENGGESINFSKDYFWV